MRKTIETMAPGDWILVEPSLSDNYVGIPWQVTSLAKSRVYVRRWRYDERECLTELVEVKYFAAKSVMHVFSTPQEALRVSDMARYLGDRLRQQIKALKAENEQVFNSYMQSIRFGEPHNPLCEHEWDPLTTNETYKCCSKCGHVAYNEPRFSPWDGIVVEDESLLSS